MSYEILRELDKTEYSRIRKKVRDNILINSRLAESKRIFFYSRASEAEMLVGGVALEKSISHSCHIYREDRGWECVPLSRLIDDPSLLSAVQRISTTATLTLFDFSGVFNITFSPPPEAFTFVKEGDIVYVAGQIHPMKTCIEQQYVIGKYLLTEEDMESYKNGTYAYASGAFSDRAAVAEIRKSCAEENLSFLLDCGGSRLDILHRFLQEIPRTKGADLYWVVAAIYGAYCRQPSEKFYDLVKKYFHQYSTSQSDIETEDQKEYYLRLLFPRMNKA